MGKGFRVRRSLGLLADQPLRVIGFAVRVVQIHGEQLVRCGRRVRACQVARWGLRF
jgi:hypothetical protein